MGDGTSPSSTIRRRLRFDRRIGHRHRRNQRLRVRHQRLAVELARLGQLDDLPEIHHRDPMRRVPNGAQDRAR